MPCEQVSTASPHEPERHPLTHTRNRTCAADTLKRELNVWDGPEDNLGNIARKLRDRGTDGKAAETEKAKKKKGLLNAGYVFGAHFVRKAGYRVEGEDRITLGKMEAEQDIYQIQKSWDALNNRRSVRASRKDN